MQRTIATLPKNSTEELKIELQNYNGHDLFAMRVFYKDPLGQEPRPTKKGVTLNVRMLPDIIEALQKAEQVALEEGILDT